MINKISPASRRAIISKSVNSLPNTPTRAGFSADDIKGAMHQFVTDEENSIIAEINRVVEETNDAIENAEGLALLDETGNSKSAGMTQDAITKELGKKLDVTEDGAVTLKEINLGSVVITPITTDTGESGIRFSIPETTNDGGGE